MAADINYKVTDDGMGVTLEALFNGMQGLIQSKTVVGEPITAGDAVIVPLIEVSAGMASGALTDKGTKKAGAMNTKISPMAVLVMQGGRTKLINIKNQDAVTRILDMVPDMVDKITGGSRVGKEAEASAEEFINNADSETFSEEI